MQTTKRKSGDLPWVNHAIRKRIKQRKAVYRREGRSSTWKRLKKVTEAMLSKRKEKYVLVQKDNLLARDSDRAYFKNVKSYKTASRPKPFDVTTLFPGKSEEEVAEALAVYFTKVSNEFQPLQPEEILVTYDKELPFLELHEVASRIRYFKKPKSMVRGDVFPSLMTKYSDFFAIPLRSIYNQITASKIWPLCWKRYLPRKFMNPLS